MTDKIKIGIYIIMGVLVLWLSGREEARGTSRIRRILIGIFGTPAALAIFLYSRRRREPFACMILPWLVIGLLNMFCVMFLDGIRLRSMRSWIDDLDLSRANGSYVVGYDSRDGEYDYYYVPSDLMARKPEEVGYILIYSKMNISEEYTLGPVKGEWLSVKLVDADTDEVLGDKEFKTYFPERVKVGERLRVSTDSVIEWYRPLLPEAPGWRLGNDMAELIPVVGVLLLSLLLLLILGLRKKCEQVSVPKTRELRTRGEIDFQLLPQLVHKDPEGTFLRLTREGGAFLARTYNGFFIQRERLSGEVLPRYTRDQLQCIQRLNTVYVTLPKAQTSNERCAEAIAVTLIRKKVIYYVFERDAQGLRISIVDREGKHTDLCAADRDVNDRIVQVIDLGESVLKRESEQEFWGKVHNANKRT